ncbi:hypothetical protein [Mastigocoleus testarum]|uniref:Uncharacterized protein n=1 Tax=Mastigocoleus testarum BC008 TaxID=371196 RepID=A0A0V7ZWB0_9CYAN|nr:hypothetical protein [Mastigocoleus testarum]KST68642.1 hypothetical protein BC008_33905 [Mastigocoleus testarum BC008]
MERSEKTIWQNAINPQLKQRLIHPLSQPGVINFDMATKVLMRSQQFNNRNPLLKNPRWSVKKKLQTNKTPIVYAQPSLNNQEENSLAISPNTSSSANTSGQSSSGKSSSSAITTVKAEKINSVPPIKSSISQPIIQRKIDTSSQSNITSLSNTESYAEERYSSELPLVESELKNPKSVVSERPVVSLPFNQDNPLSQENISKINSNPIDESQTTKSSELTVVKQGLKNPESIIIDPSNKDSINLVNVNHIDDNQRNKSQTAKPYNELPLVTGEISNYEQLQKSIYKPSLPIIYPHKINNISLTQENNRNKQLQSNNVSSKSQQNNNIPLVKPQNNVNIYSSSSPKESLVVLETPKQQPQQNFTPLVFPQTNSERKSEPIVDPNIYQQIQQHNNNQNSPNSSQTSATIVNQWLVNNQSSQKPENNQPKIDINTITNQVERKLKRKLMVESERRGYKKWR